MLGKLRGTRFDEELVTLHFTSKRTDTAIVSDLYKKIFPKLAQHEVPSQALC